jgi:hypothetical protein
MHPQFQKVQNQLDLTDTLDSLLLNPVQRFPKIKMLVGDACKQFKKDGDTKNQAHMEELKPYVDEIAKYANDMIDVGYIVDFGVSSLLKNIYKSGNV